MTAVAVSAAPMPTSPSAHELIAGADQAIHENRLNQAALMISRGIGAGASGPELDRAIADFAYASGNYADAITRYDALLKLAPADQSLLEPAGIAALKLGYVARATSLLELVTSRSGADWRAWNALGVAAEYARANVAIVSAGATTIAELAAVGLPAVLVALASVARDHQTENAREFAAATDAVWCREADWDDASLAAHVAALATEPPAWAAAAAGMRRKARRGAADAVAQACLEVVDGARSVTGVTRR